jgi:hypothetical protein
MKWYGVARKAVAVILGAFWGYRADVAVKVGIALGQLILSSLVVFLLFFILIFLIHKEKKTKNINIIKREAWDDAIWAIIALILGYFLPNVFSLVL